MNSALLRVAASTSAILALSLSVVGPVETAAADVIVTQTEERSFFSLWLLSTFLQQRTAHQQIKDNHEIIVVPVFTDLAIRRADVIYLSPSLDELKLTTDEIDVLVNYVERGGRLIVPADNGAWADEFRALAARFDVTYGNSFINGVITATVRYFNNDITDGDAGRVSEFSGAAINDNLDSENPDFRVLARWPGGTVALALIEFAAGEVVFLSDFNTFDDDMLFDKDNQTLWTNLFARSGPGFECLALAVENLVAGQKAIFTLTGGTPGANGATVFGTSAGETVVNGIADYCATFGIDGVKQSRVIGGLNRSFDVNGEMAFGLNIPGNLSGFQVFFQTAENGTCPDECLSAVLEMTVQ